MALPTIGAACVCASVCMRALRGGRDSLKKIETLWVNAE